MLTRKKNKAAAWRLERTGRKEICPSCGHRTYKNYVDASGVPLAEGRCGRCDRENSCGYHLPPHELLRMERPLVPSGAPSRMRATRPFGVAAPSLIERDLMLSSLRGYSSNRLARYLHRLFDPFMEPETVEDTLRRYCVGTTRDGRTIFWQVDPQGRVHTGKIIDYDAATGRRRHTRGASTWVHSVLKERYPAFSLCQTFFGAHLLPDAGSDIPVWLMESEKAVLITALLVRRARGGEPFCSLLATGGSEGFNPRGIPARTDRHALLSGRTVFLVPDEGMFGRWKERGRNLRMASQVRICASLEPGFNYRACDHGIPNFDCPLEKGDGIDDIFIRYLERGEIDEAGEVDLHLCPCA